MNYTIEYFHTRVLAEIESWPDGILADYARIIELLMEFGPNLRMPHFVKWVVEFFRYDLGAVNELAVHSIVSLSAKGSSYCMRS